MKYCLRQRSQRQCRTLHWPQQPTSAKPSLGSPPAGRPLAAARDRGGAPQSLPFCAAAGEDDVPDGEWFCWSCGAEKGRKFPPIQPVSSMPGPLACTRARRPAKSFFGISWMPAPASSSTAAQQIIPGHGGLVPCMTQQHYRSPSASLACFWGSRLSTGGSQSTVHAVYHTEQ